MAEFVKAFRAYLVTNYAQVLTQYTNQTIEFGPEMPLEEDRRITTVKVEILDAPRPNIKLEFKLRQEKSGEWKAFDMIAEASAYCPANNRNGAAKFVKKVFWL